MPKYAIPRFMQAFAAAITLLAVGLPAAADPPARVARLGYAIGSASFSPAGADDWVQAPVNRPLVNGDRLWTDAGDGARAEIQVGGAAIRMAPGSSLRVLEVDDEIIQLQLTQGSLQLSIRRLDAEQSFEVNTPNLALVLRQPGEYRIDVDQDGASTVSVRRGQGEAYGEAGAYRIETGQAYRFTGNDWRVGEVFAAAYPDGFERWAVERERSHTGSRSARYVSADVVGYQDLDAHGAWHVDDGYGNVWLPNRVASDWVPYSDGSWAWVDPWGWTWIDNAPWGYAVSHYGRWTRLGGRWAWVPGPPRARAYYAPALVAFVGGDNFRLNLAAGRVGAVAWFPLAPREVYRPANRVSRDYFDKLNRSNAAISTSIIDKHYNNPRTTGVTHANRRVAGAIVAVPASIFVQSQPVARGRQRVSSASLAGRPVLPAPSMVPSEKSVRGAAAPGAQPPSRIFERQVVARRAVSAAPSGLAAQRERHEAQSGRYVDSASRRPGYGNAGAPAPQIKVLAPSAELLKVVAAPLPVPGRDQKPADGVSGRPAVQVADRPQGRRRDAEPAGKPGVAVLPLRAVPVEANPVVAQRVSAGERPRPDDRSADRQSRRRDAEPVGTPAVVVPLPIVQPPLKVPPVAAVPPTPAPPAARESRAEPRLIPAVARQQYSPEPSPAVALPVALPPSRPVPGEATAAAAQPSSAGERQRPDDRSADRQSRRRDAEPVGTPAVVVPLPVVQPPLKAPPVAAAPPTPVAPPVAREPLPIPAVASQPLPAERQPPVALPPPGVAPVNAIPVAARSPASERQGDRRQERNGEGKRDERDERRR